MKASANMELQAILKQNLADNAVSCEEDRLWMIRRIADLESTLPKLRPTHKFAAKKYQRPNSRCIHPLWENITA
jgi:hypothetical protein